MCPCVIGSYPRPYYFVFSILGVGVNLAWTLQWPQIEPRYPAATMSTVRGQTPHSQKDDIVVIQGNTMSINSTITLYSNLPLIPRRARDTWASENKSKVRDWKAKRRNEERMALSSAHLRDWGLNWCAVLMKGISDVKIPRHWELLGRVSRLQDQRWVSLSEHWLHVCNTWHEARHMTSSQ